MPFFDQFALAPPDTLLSLNITFKKDTRSGKVNLGVGTYKNSELQPLVLRSVRKAELLLVEQNLDKEYLPIDGDEEFLEFTKNLIFGDQYLSLAPRLLSVQSLGGTGALRIASGLLSRHSVKKIYLPDFTWPNHKSIFSATGMLVGEYPYYDFSLQKINFESLCASIQQMERGSAILFHASCQNPTGTDPNRVQWEELAALVKRQGLLPFFDCAYQGLGESLEKDSLAIKLFSEHFDEMVVAYSYSKNFGLYNERIGALIIQARQPEQVEKILSQARLVVRETYSTPPSHGSRIVKTILKDPALKQLWLDELTHMRERLVEMRRRLISGLAAKKAPINFQDIDKQLGMFAFFGLGKDQVSQLINDYGIYLPSNGRINLAGLNDKNMEYVVDAIISVMHR